MALIQWFPLSAVLMPHLAGTTPLFLLLLWALVTGCSTRMEHLYHLAFTSHWEGSVLFPRLHASLWGFSPWCTRRTFQRSPCCLAHNSWISGPSRMVYIPPSGQRFSLLHSPPEQEVEAKKPGPSHFLAQRRGTWKSKSPYKGCQRMKRSGSKQQAECPEQPQNNCSGDLPWTSRPLKTKGVLTSLKCSPRPLDLNSKHTQDSLSRNIQMSPMGSSSEDQVDTSSYTSSCGTCPASSEAWVRSSSALWPNPTLLLPAREIYEGSAGWIPFAQLARFTNFV